MVWPFNRKKDNTTDSSLPPEVHEYYQAERRDRTGMAWLLAAGTLVATVLLVLGLFFGGRWVYRAVTDRNDDAATTQTEEGSEESQADSDRSQSPQDTDGQSGDEQSGENGQGDDETDDQPVQPLPAPTEPSDTPSAPEGSASDLPGTGPGDMTAIFLLVTAGAALLHAKLRVSAER